VSSEVHLYSVSIITNLYPHGPFKEVVLLVLVLFPSQGNKAESKIWVGLQSKWQKISALNAVTVWTEYEFMIKNK